MPGIRALARAGSCAGTLGLEDMSGEQGSNLRPLTFGGERSSSELSPTGHHLPFRLAALSFGAAFLTGAAFLAVATLAAGAGLASTLLTLKVRVFMLS